LRLDAGSRRCRTRFCWPLASRAPNAAVVRRWGLPFPGISPVIFCYHPVIFLQLFAGDGRSRLPACTA